MARIGGDLDPETGETLLTALDAVLDAGARSSKGPDGRTPTQRRADALGEICRQNVIVRDRHCRFPGCDRRQTWCDAHHVRHWSEGGDTSLSNLLLLCRHHHRLIHRPDGFTLEMDEGRALFRRPDGSVLAERAPP